LTSSITLAFMATVKQHTMRSNNNKKRASIRRQHILTAAFTTC